MSSDAADSAGGDEDRAAAGRATDDRESRSVTDDGFGPRDRAPGANPF